MKIKIHCLYKIICNRYFFITFLIFISISLCHFWIAESTCLNMSEIGGFLSGIGTIGLFFSALFIGVNELHKMRQQKIVDIQIDIAGELLQATIDLVEMLEWLARPINLYSELNLRVPIEQAINQIWKSRLDSSFDVIQSFQKAKVKSWVYLDDEKINKKVEELEDLVNQIKEDIINNPIYSSYTEKHGEHFESVYNQERKESLKSLQNLLRYSVRSNVFSMGPNTDPSLKSSKKS